MRIETIDLEFQGAEHVIASFLVHGPTGPVLIETGPSTTLPTLLRKLEERGISAADIHDVLVTHIHLDHAGAAGWWARQGARVWVHHRGAPHLIDPGRLLQSATRIYGDRMEKLWGDVPSAPEDRVMAVEHEAILEVGGLRIKAIETPGHAGHHHAFAVGDVVFAGDAAGIALPDQQWVDLPAPPPEFDREAWLVTLRRIRDLNPGSLYRTHFGPSPQVGRELDAFEEVLVQATDWIREMLDEGLERGAMVERFSKRMTEWAVSRGVPGADMRAYELANPRVMSVDGITRYWRKQLMA